MPGELSGCDCVCFSGTGGGSDGGGCKDPRHVLAHPSKQQRPLSGQSQSGSPTLQQFDTAEEQEETGGMAETSGHCEETEC